MKFHEFYSEIRQNVPWSYRMPRSDAIFALLVRQILSGIAIFCEQIIKNWRLKILKSKFFLQQLSNKAKNLKKKRGFLNEIKKFRDVFRGIYKHIFPR